MVAIIGTWWVDVRRAYEDKIKSGHVDRFWASSGFLGGFVLRLVLLRWRLSGRGSHIDIGGTHIHHMVPGLILVLGSGILAEDRDPGPRTALAFGLGSGMILDEASLLVFLADDYWTDRGVVVSGVSYGVMFAVLLYNLCVGFPFYSDVAGTTATTVLSTARKLQAQLR